MSSAFRMEVDGRGLATVTFDVPDRRVNVWSRATFDDFEALLDDLVERSDLTAVVFRSGKPTTFVAGADVEELAAAVDSPEEARAISRRGQAVFQRVADLSVPTVAAIHGACVGGGLEFALACSFRVASDADATRFGFPEIQLGIIPAWGGTQRAPRLVSLEDALGLILTGNLVPARKAERMGLIDKAVPAASLDERAASVARAAARGERAAVEQRDGLKGWLLKRTPFGRGLVLSQARRRVESRSGSHYPAPFKAIEAIDVGLSRGMSAGLEYEADAVADLTTTPAARNLMWIYGLRESAKRPPVQEPPRPVAALGILGAGVMGGGIAEVSAYNGIRVRLKDIALERVADGLKHAAGVARKARRKGVLDRRGERDLMHRISGTVDYGGFRRLDVVVEAIVEDLEVKRRVLAEVEGVVGEATVLATNTSSLRVDDLATALSRPEAFGGLHFFNPVEKMPLVEVVRGERTSDSTLATLHGLALRLGKTPVVVRDGPGFWVNRLLMPYLNEAVHLYAEGVPIATLDGALEEFGLPLGPLALLDEIGLDIAAKVAKVMADAYPDRMHPHALLHRLQASERVGRKSGRGFYRYEGGERKGPDEKLRDQLMLPTGETPVYDEDYLVARCLLPMVNEASRALAEGIVASPGDGDLALVMGIGWPPFRGGLLRWADALGLAEIVERLERWASLVDPRFTPSAELRARARDGEGFYGPAPAALAGRGVLEDQGSLGF